MKNFTTLFIPDILDDGPRRVRSHNGRDSQSRTERRRRRWPTAATGLGRFESGSFSARRRCFTGINGWRHHRRHWRRRRRRNVIGSLRLTAAFHRRRATDQQRRRATVASSTRFSDVVVATSIITSTTAAATPTITTSTAASLRSRKSVEGDDEGWMISWRVDDWLSR